MLCHTQWRETISMYSVLQGFFLTLATSAKIAGFTVETNLINEVCSKVFSQRGHLTEHMRIHTREKPYQYTVCNKGFTTSSSLNTHDDAQWRQT